MLTNHFYHEIIRKTIVSFGTLFNNIEIKHTDRSGKTVSVIKVPISYGPQQKFLARVSQSREYQDGVGTTLTLPRMSFEVMGMNYDATRKVSTMQTFKSVNKNTNKRYHDMLTAFNEKYGCPVIVNTSFNVRGEPIVCTVEDAFKCFMGTKLDMLVCGNFILYKSKQNPKLYENYKNKYSLD